LIVVLGHHATGIAARLNPVSGVRVAVNPDYRRGMLSSLQTGLRVVPDTASQVLFTLVDHPAVAEATIDRLISEFASSGRRLAIPRHGERRGHPVLLSRQAAEEILALPPEGSAKDVIRGHRDETLFVDVDDPGVLRDIDLPSDYDDLVREHTR
jgi:CTP:molybdopterin cytidylyltransferase MocA